MANAEKHAGRTKEELMLELGGEEEFCDCCPLPKEAQGVHCYGGDPVMCEGRYCPEALEEWLEQEADDDEI